MKTLLTILFLPFVNLRYDMSIAKDHDEAIDIWCAFLVMAFVYYLIPAWIIWGLIVHTIQTLIILGVLSGVTTFALLFGYAIPKLLLHYMRKKD